MESGVFGGQRVGNRLDFGYRLRFGFAGDGAAFDLHFAGRGVGAEAAAAAEHGGMERRRPDQRMRRARAQVAFEFAEAGEERAHLHIGVDAQFELAAVGGAARDLDLDPQVAFVGEADFQRGGLGDDGAIHFDAPDQVARAEAAVLFIGDGGYQEVAAQARAGIHQGLGRRHARGQAALHIVGAAAVELAVADGAGERLGHAGHVHRIAMGVEHEAAAAARTRRGARARWRGRARAPESAP